MQLRTAQYYDRIYSFKDYEADVRRLIPIIRENLQSGGNRLLDVACGTGRHIEYLRAHFHVEGLDISAEMLEVARERNPGVPVHEADMVDFDLGTTFDVVVSLFSSIGYVKTLENLHRSVACMARHTVPGGLVIVEPWFAPDAWSPNTVHGIFIDEPDLKIARVSTSFVDGGVSIFDLHHLIGTPEGTEHIVEHHELGLFTTDEMRDAFAGAGLEVTYDAEGLSGRGLYVGRKP
jgi:SAM-dependent methyltransferase